MSTGEGKPRDKDHTDASYSICPRCGYEAPNYQNRCPRCGYYIA